MSDKEISERLASLTADQKKAFVAFLWPNALEPLEKAAPAKTKENAH